MKILNWDSNQRRQLLLMIKESMHNVIKHARSKYCQVEIALTQSGINFMIKDEGVGIVADKSDGNGLNNLKSRAGKIGARIAILENEPKGTKINIFLPTPQMGYSN